MAPLTQKYIKIVAGHHFDYALRDDGVTWDFFGSDFYGESSLPSGVVEIFTGREHCIGRFADGSLVVWDHPPYSLPDPNLVSLPLDEKIWGLTGDDSNWFHAGLSGCFGNCDRSTIAPVLNVNDFICFGNEFAALSSLPPTPANRQLQINSRANCDGSTNVPVLTSNDFLCFDQAYVDGCP